jgi:aminoglycoside phosphotransferase (APT) family kinase protein
MSAPNRPGHPDPAAVREILRTIDPGLRLVSGQPQEGGVSAQVTVIEAARPDGGIERLTLRQYGSANLRADPHVATHEFHLLGLLHDARLPVPKPYRADESGAVLPGPWLAVEFIEGATVIEPGRLKFPQPTFTGQLAAFLAQLHHAPVTLADVPYLVDIRTRAKRKMETWSAAPDQALDEAAIRAALDRIWPPQQANRPVVLHGDYWPGNVLWRDDNLVGVIDWEDAAAGDPLADLANTRMELTMAFGASVAIEFTERYCQLMPGLDTAALSHWDLYAALRHAGRMDEWGMTAADKDRLQTGHREFTALVFADLDRAR